MRHTPEAFFLAGAVLLVLDNWRLRRRLRVDRVARAAEEALGPPRIGDIDMPDPSDPRWEMKDQTFTIAGTRKQERTLALGSEITVTSDGYVYIGNGPAIEGGERYGKRVIQAYKRRLVEAARRYVP